MVLPSSLIAMRIEDFPVSERLSSIAHSLPCLKYLGLFNCEHLKLIHEDGLPQSLTRLEILNCPQLDEICKVDGDFPDIQQISENAVKLFNGW